jgi:hypothetical protein
MAYFLLLESVIPGQALSDKEYRALVQLAEVLPTDVKVLILEDREFGDQKLYQVLTDELNFDYLIRSEPISPCQHLLQQKRAP